MKRATFVRACLCHFVIHKKSLADAFKHNANIRTIARRAVLQGMSALVGVVYDELALSVSPFVFAVRVWI